GYAPPQAEAFFSYTTSPPDHLSGRLSIQGVSSTLRRTINSYTTVGYITRGQPGDHLHCAQEQLHK
ncbi:hypothetical protein L195_g060283, partial [Trifolium pratense]